MFSVAAIVNEPLATVHRFVAWYLEQGAQEITLFFDNPDDGAIAALAGVVAPMASSKSGARICRKIFKY